VSDADPRAFRLVVSYRRVDTGGDARSLAETLADRFGEENVFFDIHGIAPGEPFDQVIAKAVAASDVFIACIGQHWLTVAAADGTRRIDDPEDYVRRELEGALAAEVRVIPITFEGAQMPGEDDLPDSLKPFSTRNAVDVRATRWHEDVGDFVDYLVELKRKKLRGARKGFRAVLAGICRDSVDWAWHSGRRRRGVVLTSAAVVLAVVLGGFGIWAMVEDDQPQGVTPASASGNGSTVAGNTVAADAGPTLAYSSGSKVFLSPENGRPKTLPGNGLRKEPDWSPDGTRLAYSEGGDIWTSDLEGGDTVQVTNGDDVDGSPAWSPDGSQIAFNRKTDEGPARVFVVEAGGGEPAELVDGGAPDWSADGRRIVFQRDNAVWVADADGTDERNLTQDYGRAALFPAWSPDGTRIAFILPDPREEATGCKLVVVKPNGVDRRDLPPLERPQKCRDTSWSPDGRRLVVAGGEEGIFSVRRDGTGTVEQLDDAPGALSPSLSPAP
jgi:TIR domain-containing protein/WD40 repeat protein